MSAIQRDTQVERKKVGVTFENQLPYLLEIDITRPIKSVVADLCTHYKLNNPEDFALQFKGSKQQIFVTERNRSEIQNGLVMELTPSPARMAKNILDSLDAGSESKQCTAMKTLSELSVDDTFTQEFINIKGLNEIIQMIQSGTFSGDMLAYMLKAFVELMDHGIVSWDVLEPKFITTVANCINNSKIVDVTTLQSALEILESIVLHSSGKYSTVEREVSASSLIPHLQSQNEEVQKNAIALINALFQRADPEKRKKIAENLQSKSMRNHILDNIIRKGNLSADMAHQLYILQNLMFNLLNEKRNTPADVNEQSVQSNIQELRQIAFDTDPESSSNTKRQSHLNEFKKLGFQNQMNPAEDFVRVPPGMLALSCMMYFAKNHSENYTKVVLENSCRGDNHDLPFALASIELTNMMCDILKIGENPADDGQTYYPLFFTHDHAFEEFYCTCIQLLNKTWKEMKATSADFNKVFAVVREQISRALSAMPLTFDNFRTKLSHLTYQEIVALWQKDRQLKEEWESQAKPIVELREQITPEIMELIKKQRLNYLMEGTQFTLKVARRQDKHFYCRLSPNHKVFHYGDCEEHAVLSIEQLPNKLAVVDIKELLVGKECPHIKDKKKVNTSWAFTLQPEEPQMNEPLNFITDKEETFNIWLDGINALLGKSMTSEETKRDLETLLSMEIKLRLLDTEGINIPETPPPIPKEPPNYDFVFKNI